MILGVCSKGRWLAGLSFSLLLLIHNLALEVGVVSSEDTYYIYVTAAEAEGIGVDICNYMDVLLNWVLL